MSTLIFRATQSTNRFTILLNNMRLMGIFDWWLAVLDFISKSVENPAPAANTEEVAKEGQSGAAAARTKVFLQVGLAVQGKSVTVTPSGTAKKDHLYCVIVTE